MGFLSRIRTFESLSLRDYRFLWSGQMTTAFAHWMDQVARAWLVYDLTHSALQLGLVSALRGIPLLIFGVLAGVAADRWGRKNQLIIAQVVNAVLSIVLATLVLTGRVEVWHIYVTAVLAGTAQAFQQPARQALINDLVGEKYLLNAISLSSAGMNMSRSVGPAIAGLLIQNFGVAVSYYVDSGFYLLASLWLALIHVPESSTALIKNNRHGNQSVFSSARDGFSYIFSNRLVLALMVLALAPAVLAMPFVSLMPVFAVDVFGGGATLQGLLLSAIGVGGIIGAFGMASAGRLQGRGKLVIGAAGAFGTALVFFSQSPIVPIALFFAFLIGFFQTSYNAQNQTALQLIVPGELRGRVLGIYVLDRGLMPAGSFMAGILAQFLGGPWAVTIMGLSCLLVAIGVGLFAPDLWKMNLITMGRAPSSHRSAAEISSS
ncbi:MAG: MFS transporter [Chloroflexi bacterium]|nr:MFS transporter [Chloroflexota bacterium]